MLLLRGVGWGLFFCSFPLAQPSTFPNSSESPTQVSLYFPSMAAAGAWLRRAAAAAPAMPRIPFALPALPTPPPPAPVLEAPALALPARGAAMDLMAVPKKKVDRSFPLLYS
jgi:hypothetical protein